MQTIPPLIINEIQTFEQRVLDKAKELALKSERKSYIQNHIEKYKTGERWGLFGWGGNKYATRTI